MHPLAGAIDAIATETGFSGIVRIANTSERAWPATSRLAELLGMDG